MSVGGYQLPEFVNPADMTTASTSRLCKNGRRIWYQLAVLQQPERARACGSGTKSANDRRPVDPPPVVELRVFEGPTEQDRKDITFVYNASFFLFVTLEHSRVIAHGRVQQAQNADNAPPVLTGSPVSGMAYLDRPNEAGYFLFPDLSVRHEGNYRLVFGLYEQPKETQDYDADQDSAADNDEGPFIHRLDVKSTEFSVFSAKKFPGLAESTMLSRMVAEQGCRVRIRRDVRMRRRDTKPATNGTSTADYEKNEDDFSRNRRRASQTPDVSREAYFRPRSDSSASDHRGPYPADAQRRPSGVEAYPPPPGFAPAQAQSNLQFGDMQHRYPQYPSTPQSAAQPPVSPVTPYPPPPHTAAYPQAPYANRPASRQEYPISPITEAHERRISENGAFTPASVPERPTMHESSAPARSAEGAAMLPNILTPTTPNHAEPRTALPPISSLLSGPAPSSKPMESIIHSKVNGPHTNGAASVAHPPPPKLTDWIEPAPSPVRRQGNKRGLDEHFNVNSGPQKNGQRQQDPHHDANAYPGQDDPGKPMEWHRADGRSGMHVWNWGDYNH